MRHYAAATLLSLFFRRRYARLRYSRFLSFSPLSIATPLDAIFVTSLRCYVTLRITIHIMPLPPLLPLPFRPLFSHTPDIDATRC